MNGVKVKGIKETCKNEDVCEEEGKGEKVEKK
jgi:hypothetical protein